MVSSYLQYSNAYRGITAFSPFIPIESLRFLLFDQILDCSVALLPELESFMILISLFSRSISSVLGVASIFFSTYNGGRKWKK